MLSRLPLERKAVLDPRVPMVFELGRHASLEIIREFA